MVLLGSCPNDVRPRRLRAVSGLLLILLLGFALVSITAGERAQAAPAQVTTTTPATATTQKPVVTTSPTTVAKPATTAAPTTKATSPPTTASRPATTAAPRASTTVGPAPTTARTPTTAAAAATPSTTAETSMAPSPTTTELAAVLLVAGPNDTTPSSGTKASEVLTPATKLKLVVGGLLALAILILVLTFAYWRHTRPYDWDDEWDEDGAANPSDVASPPAVDSPAVAVPESAAPVVPTLIPVGLAASVVRPRLSDEERAGNAAPQMNAPRSTVDEPTAAFEPLGTGAVLGPVLEPAPLPIVTLEDLQRTSLIPEGLAGAGKSPGGSTVDAPTEAVAAIDSAVAAEASRPVASPAKDSAGTDAPGFDPPGDGAPNDGAPVRDIAGKGVLSQETAPAGAGQDEAPKTRSADASASVIDPRVAAADRLVAAEAAAEAASAAKATAPASTTRSDQAFAPPKPGPTDH